VRKKEEKNGNVYEMGQERKRSEDQSRRSEGRED
jgi:hypothetical protein